MSDGNGHHAATATFDPISRQTVSAEIRQRLADAIQTGQLAPGAPLPAERVLCQEFGVARTSVREAIQGLVIAGYVERRGNRSVVAERLPEVNFTGDDRKALVTQLFEVRQVIEPAIAELAARRATDERAGRDRRPRRARHPHARRVPRRSTTSSTPPSPGRAATRCSTRSTPRRWPRCSAPASWRRCSTPRSTAARSATIITPRLAAHRAIAEAIVKGHARKAGGGRGRPPRRRRAPDGGAAAVTEVRERWSTAEQYCYFFDDDAFVEEGRPGFRRRVILGERPRAVVLADHRRHRRLGPAPPPGQRADRDHRARRSSTSASATPTTTAA